MGAWEANMDLYAVRRYSESGTWIEATFCTYAAARAYIREAAYGFEMIIIPFCVKT